MPKPDPVLGLADEVRYWRSVDRSDPYGCWRWTGSRNYSGYGIMTILICQAAHHWAHHAGAEAYRVGALVRRAS